MLRGGTSGVRPMTLFSFKTLAFAWTGLAGLAAVGAGVLQASYVLPAPPTPIAQVAATLPPPPVPVAVPATPGLPFQNRSLLVVLPPPVAAPRTPPRLAAVDPLPVPPVPPMHVAHAEPRRVPAARTEPEPAYASAYPGWDWRRPLPYPGMYASGRAYYYGGQTAYYGWQPE